EMVAPEVETETTGDEATGLTATGVAAMDSDNDSGVAAQTVRAERPRELSGYTWQIPFDGQNLYVTVNNDGRDILEVFATGPISGGVGLLASKMLRGGFEAKEVARSLNKVAGNSNTLRAATSAATVVTRGASNGFREQG